MTFALDHPAAPRLQDRINKAMAALGHKTVRCTAPTYHPYTTDAFSIGGRCVTCGTKIRGTWLNRYAQLKPHGKSKFVLTIEEPEESSCPDDNGPGPSQ